MQEFPTRGWVIRCDSISVEEREKLADGGVPAEPETRHHVFITDAWIFLGGAHLLMWAAGENIAAHERAPQKR